MKSIIDFFIALCTIISNAFFIVFEIYKLLMLFIEFLAGFFAYAPVFLSPYLWISLASVVLFGVLRLI